MIAYQHSINSRASTDDQCLGVRERQGENGRKMNSCPRGPRARWAGGGRNTLPQARILEGNMNDRDKRERARGK